MGRGWIKGLGIELRSVMDVKAIKSVEKLVAEYARVFDDALGTFKGVSTKITIEDNAKPRFFKARPVPFAMIDRVNEELMRMERVGVLHLFTDASVTACATNYVNHGVLVRNERVCNRLRN
ncbi:hypothetical protein MRX96_045565 [Rhipicephalus microplus]